MGERFMEERYYFLWIHGDSGSERLSSMMEVTQLVHDNAGTQMLVSYLQTHVLLMFWSSPRCPIPRSLGLLAFHTLLNPSLATLF